jgi:biotin carboxylase
VQAQQIPFPIVLKPIDSAGSDNVHICAGWPQVDAAFERILASRNSLLRPNTEVLVQEYLVNDELRLDASMAAPLQRGGVDVEYCVNTVSFAGTHHVTEIIKVYRTRVGDAPVHDYNELLCPVADAGAYAVLGGYIEKVLDALGIAYGPAHSELMVVGNEPVLLETAARLPGGIDLSAYTKALGSNQLMATVQSCIDPGAFLAQARQPRTPLRFHSSCVFLISDRQGTITGQPELGPWLALPSLHSLKLRDQGQLERTDALFNAPGQIFLLAQDPAALRRDRAALRAHEAQVYASLLKA